MPTGDMDRGAMGVRYLLSGHWKIQDEAPLMRSCELPEMYMPYPARLNPHVESARAHARVWAQAVGLLNQRPSARGARAWDSAEFDALDLALFAALTYPDAAGPELDLLTDWYVWSWYTDNYFLDALRDMGPIGAKEYVRRLAAFTPVEATSTPKPNHAVEAGLADLWARTVPAMSAEWRTRLFEVCQRNLQHTLWGLFDRWAPDPIDYFTGSMRTPVGMELVACLTEHALGVEIPSEIYATRPLRVIREAFGDGVALRNDILLDLSARDSGSSQQTARRANGVIVVERFLGCDPRRAAHVVNELATSRTQQFENTALTELPLLFEERRLGPEERVRLLRYVKGLQDWMAGSFQWSTRGIDAGTPDRSPGPAKPPRRLDSPTGLGTSAARPGRARQEGPPATATGPTGLGMVAARLGLERRAASVVWPRTSPTGAQTAARASRIELPEIYLPYRARCNPQLPAARAHAKAWAIEMGLLGTGMPGWDEAGFDAADYAGQSGWAFPDAPGAKLDVAAQWSVWGWYAGTFFEENFTRPRDLAGAKALVDRLADFMPIADPRAVPVPTTPLERSLADLWPRTAVEMPASWRRWFVESYRCVGEGQRWKISNLLQKRVPDPVDYIEMRQHSTAGWTSILLLQYVQGLEIPPAIFRARALHGLHDTLLNWQTLLNDVFSYEKELDGEDDPHNGVLIMQRFLGGDLRRAVTLTNDLLTSQLRHFEHIAATQMAALFQEFGVDSADRRGLDGYVQGLRGCFVAYLQLYRHLRASRYAPDAGSKAPDAGSKAPAAAIGAVRAILDAAPRPPPFKLPEFYVPYPARLNPHLEATRKHSKAWAYEKGILGTKEGSPGAEVWSERKFDTMDFALLTSYAHPDTPAAELDLLTDWYVWVFYFDDHFVEAYKHTRDLAGAKKYLDRLLSFMPMNPGDAMPEPANPVELGLRDLWPRTIATMSESWRERYWESTYNLLYSSLWELNNLNQQRMPNMIDYIGMRRRVGGAPWSADLVEHAIGVEVPAALVATRAMRVLKDTFSDSIHLLNDIFSYQREIEEEGEQSNGVLVVERLMGCTPQQAVEVVNDLVTSRLQQFENTVLTEVPLLGEDHELDAKAWSDVLRYVKGLQDWLAGDHAWHLRSSRYMNAGGAQLQNVGPYVLPPAPTGLGGLVERLGIRVRSRSVAGRAAMTIAGKSERLELPKFFMPYRVRCNPHLKAARIHAKAWAVKMGMLESGLSGWDEHDFDSTDLPLFAAMICPEAPIEKLEVVAKWVIWGFFYEDFMDESFKRTRDSAGAKAFQERMLTFMPVAHPAVIQQSLQLFVRPRGYSATGRRARVGPDVQDRPVKFALVPTNAVERALVDLWPGTANSMSEDWLHQFRWSIEYFFPGFLWEIHNLTQDRVPDPVDYFEMRRRTNGIVTPIALMQYAIDREIPSDLLRSLPMLRLIDTVIDWESLINDVFSYQKEIDREQDFHNSVLVIQRFLEVDLRRAVSIANDLATSQLRTFEETVATDLPALAVEFNLDAEARENLDRCVEALRDLIAGYLHFHPLSGRYDTTTAARAGQAKGTSPATVDPALVRLLGGPAGLGTASARIGAR